MKNFHTAPKGYEYWTEEFNTRLTRIWIKNCSMDFTFGDDKYPSSIWGFFNNKTSEYIAPINHKKPGKVVNIKNTTPYSAMQLKLNPLMAVFL